jgi:predicted glycosyltransferase
LGFLRKSIQHKITAWTSNFDEIWIPDLQGSHSLSQDLSFSTSKNPQLKHIGILSRFSSNQIVHNTPNGYLAIISGPEPQRTILFQELLRIEKTLSLGMTIIIDKISNKVSSDEMDNMRILVQPNDREFLQEISNAQHIVCRPGYSSLMDLIRLKRTALFIPTPGQTEQEYLAEENIKWGFGFKKQSTLKAIKSIEDWEPCFKSNEQLNDTFPEEENQSHVLLKNAVRDFLMGLNRSE